MIELKGVRKSYQMGAATVHALDNVSLKIESGEFAAIMGPSGSGKSTLLHILGLLDVPDSGSYLLYGKEVANLNQDELAVLRRVALGFVFQQFDLLPRMTALENVALPCLYSQRRLDLEKARTLLEKVGLGERIAHKPNELSGGQQQRVAIARSLINSPRMILADEPTGNLDTASREEIIGLLRALNEQGITVVIVTHEEEIARKTRRIIRIRDGIITSDERLGAGRDHAAPGPQVDVTPAVKRRFFGLEILEHLVQGLKTLGLNKVRTGLSVLGILIGVAAVVAMMALGSGAQKAIETQLASLGSNLLVLRPGSMRVGGVALQSGAVTRLTEEDVAGLKTQVPGIKEVCPNVNGRAQVTYQGQNWNTQVLGASASYARMHVAVPEIGRFFTDDENQKRSRVVVVGLTIVRNLFQGQNPVGEFMKVNRVIFQVIGVLPEKGANSFRDQDDIVIVPVLTAMHRLLGKEYVDYVDIEVAKASDMDAVQESSMALMMSRHRIPPSQQQDAFQIRNMADIQEAVSSSSRTMSLLLASIAAISLLVGGIGIMNIMLVSVTERTREIGLRKAVGATRKDILSQFLAEAFVVSSVGGLSGVLIGGLITEVMAAITGWTTSISPTSVILAFFFSASIGVVFGMYPARKASALNPIDALRYE